MFKRGQAYGLLLQGQKAAWPGIVMSGYRNSPCFNTAILGLACTWRSRADNNGMVFIQALKYEISI